MPATRWICAARRMPVPRAAERCRHRPRRRAARRRKFDHAGCRQRGRDGGCRKAAVRARPTFERWRGAAGGPPSAASNAAPRLAAGCPVVLGLVAPLRNSLRELAFAPLRQPQRVGRRGALRARATSPGLAGRAVPVARPLARQEQSTGLFLSGLASSALHRRRSRRPTHGLGPVGASRCKDPAPASGVRPRTAEACQGPRAGRCQGAYAMPRSAELAAARFSPDISPYPVETRTASRCECSFIEVLNLDGRVGRCRIQTVPDRVNSSWA